MFFKFDRYTHGSFGQQFRNRYPVYTRASTSSTFGTNYRLNRYNANTDDLTGDSVLEDWLPQTPQLLNKLFRNIHRYDSIAGPAVDLISIMPFSDATLVGVDDPSILKVYEQSLEELHIETLLPEIALEYLVVGRTIGSLLFDSAKGIWTDIILQDPDYCELTNIPLRGFDPKINLKISGEFKQFLCSTDPRDKEAQKDIPPDFLEELLKADIVPLDPVSTLYLPRKEFPADYLGSSIYYRILPFYALEKTLINGTLIGAKRRQRSILHITVGENELWEPDEDDISSIAGMFMNADEDPQGAIVATRNGVATNEVRSGQDFWKISDEWDFLSTAKMRALGISEGFLSGDVNYNTAEVSLSVFIEMLRTFRDSLTSKIFYEKLFPTLAIVHGFKKRTQAELAHKIRIVGRTVDSSLIVPQMNFHKQLRPEADSAYLEVLSTMEEKGIPIPLRTWAAAGGLSLERILDMQGEDIKNREDVQGWREKIPKGVQGEGDKETWGSFVNAEIKTVKRSLDIIPVWINNSFFGIPQKVFIQALRSSNPASHLVAKFSGRPAYQLAIANYILRRMGVRTIPFDIGTVRSIAAYLKKCASVYEPKRIAAEFVALNNIIREAARGYHVPSRGNSELQKLLKTAPKTAPDLYVGKM